MATSDGVCPGKPRNGEAGQRGGGHDSFVGGQEGGVVEVRTRNGEGAYKALLRRVLANTSGTGGWVRGGDIRRKGRTGHTWCVSRDSASALSQETHGFL